VVMAGKTRVIAWGITGITVVAIVIIGAVTLLRGGLLAPGGGAAPPLSLSVLPAGLNSASPAASSSACTLSAASEVSQGNLAVNQSSISVSIDIYPGTTVTGVSIGLTARQSVPASVYAACASMLPRNSATPSGWQVVQLPEVPGSTVPLPALKTGGTFKLIVQPPLSRTSSAVGYVWQINVTYTYPDGPGTFSSDSFATLVPAA